MSLLRRLRKKMENTNEDQDFHANLDTPPENGVSETPLEGIETPAEEETPEVIEEVPNDPSFNCSDCKGTGLKDDFNVCSVCGGTGKV